MQSRVLHGFRLRLGLIQDRDGGIRVVGFACRAFPSIRLIWADSGYCGRFEEAIASSTPARIEIVRRPGEGRAGLWGSNGVALAPPLARGGFVVARRRWVVERTFAWLGNNRRLAKDFEAGPRSAVAWLLIASISLLIRRLGR
jgi:transposase